MRKKGHSKKRRFGKKEDSESKEIRKQKEDSGEKRRIQVKRE